MPFSPLAVPPSGSNVLVFVPHPDDETAGCCALIKKSLSNGCNVKVVMVTNGDGVGLLDILKYKISKPSPEYFEKIAYLRQNETKKAMSLLGLSEENIIFLGYPDRCSLSLWRKHWDKDKPFTSSYTKRNYSFYKNSFTPKTLYSGICLVEDIEKIIRQFNPTHIVYPHFFDCHVDHFTTNNFVKYAIARLDIEVNELTYLIHRGNWPVPPGRFPWLILAPPKALESCGIRWYSLSLSSDDIKLKEQCLSSYTSQTSNFIMKIYLLSFLRRNELFGVCGNFELNSASESSTIDSITIVSPYADTLKGYLNKPADICDLRAGLTNDFLSFTISFLQEPSPVYTYLLDLFFFDAANTTRRAILRYHKGQLGIFKFSQDTIGLPSDAECTVINDSIHISLPLTQLPQFKSILVNVLTLKGDKLIDRSGSRLIKVSVSGQRKIEKTFCLKFLDIAVNLSKDIYPCL